MRRGLVLFDLDGTLVHTAPDIADAVNRVLALRQLPEVPEAWVRSRIGHGSRQLLAQAHATATRLLAGEEQPAPLPALIEEFARHYADCVGRRGRIYPGAMTALAQLRRSGVKLALLTNKEERFARRVLEQHGLAGRFDLELFGDSLAAKKPDPLPVRHALERFKVAPARALLVGDSAIDVRTGHNAGIPVWAVSYGYGSKAEIAEAAPERVIDSLAQVRASIYSPRASSSSLYLRSSPRNW
jgi:phosphoglycolate phosphatase